MNTKDQYKKKLPKTILQSKIKKKKNQEIEKNQKLIRENKYEYYFLLYKKKLTMFFWQSPSNCCSFCLTKSRA